MLDISAFLDPRFKDLDPFVAVTERVDIEEAVKLEILELVEDKSDDIDIVDVDETDQPMKETSNEQHQDQETPSSEIVPPAKKRKGAVSSLFSDLSKAKRDKKIVLSKFDSIKCKLDHYKREQVADLDDDPLEWWKSNHTHYPMIAELVRKFWSLPATSVRSEEVFSVAGGILTKKRNRLLPSNVDKLVFIHDNT